MFEVDNDARGPRAIAVFFAVLAGVSAVSMAVAPAILQL